MFRKFKNKLYKTFQSTPDRLPKRHDRNIGRRRSLVDYNSIDYSRINENPNLPGCSNANNGRNQNERENFSRNFDQRTGIYNENYRGRFQPVRRAVSSERYATSCGYEIPLNETFSIHRNNGSNESSIEVGYEVPGMDEDSDFFRFPHRYPHYQDHVRGGRDSAPGNLEVHENDYYNNFYYNQCGGNGPPNGHNNGRYDNYPFAPFNPLLFEYDQQEELDDTIMNSQLSIQKFDPTNPKGPDARTFINNYARWIEFYGANWPESKKIQTIHFFIQVPATDFMNDYEISHKNAGTWDELTFENFMNDFVAAFPSKGGSHQLECKLATRTLQPGETIESYLYNILDLISKTDPDAKFDRILFHVNKGLPNDLRAQFMLSRPKDIKDLKENILSLGQAHNLGIQSSQVNPFGLAPVSNVGLLNQSLTTGTSEQQQSNAVVLQSVMESIKNKSKGSDQPRVSHRTKQEKREEAEREKFQNQIEEQIEKLSYAVGKLSKQQNTSRGRGDGNNYRNNYRNKGNRGNNQQSNWSPQPQWPQQQQQQWPEQHWNYSIPQLSKQFARFNLIEANPLAVTSYTPDNYQTQSYNTQYNQPSTSTGGYSYSEGARGDRRGFRKGSRGQNRGRGRGQRSGRGGSGFNGRGGQSRDSSGQVICYTCNRPGHYASDCLTKSKN
jgi:hypothetical protein